MYYILQQILEGIREKKRVPVRRLEKNDFCAIPNALEIASSINTEIFDSTINPSKLISQLADKIQNLKLKYQTCLLARQNKAG